MSEEPPPPAPLPETPPSDAPAAVPQDSPEERDAKRRQARQRAQERFIRRTTAVTDALRTLLRDFHADAFPESGSGGKPGEITLQLHVDPESDWALSFSPDLAEQLMHQFEDAEAGSDQFVDGAVFNFHAESNDHPLCRPPSTTEVFAGYNSLGQPQWKELAQVLIDHKDERVDRLYAKGGPVVCLIQRGKELKQELLTSFGKSSKTFSLLGQVVAGYVRIPAGIPLPPGTPNRAAITFQIVKPADVAATSGSPSTPWSAD